LIETTSFPEVCQWCHQPFELKIHEVWDGRDFMLAGCCEAVEAEAMEWLRDPEDGAALLRALDLEALVPGRGHIRRVIEDDCRLRLDWNIEVRLILRHDRFTRGHAREFIRRHHGHARNTNAAWRFGCTIWNGPLMLGVVWVGNPVSRVLMKRDPGLIEVNRLCLDRSVSRQLRWKAASVGYNWAAKEAERRGFTSIQTYTLADSETGMSLRYARWKVWDDDAGGKTWDSPARVRKNSTAPGRKVRWGKHLRPVAPIPISNRNVSVSPRQLSLQL
jgi:hypothetical protein